MCVYDQNADTSCLKRDIDVVMRDLAGRIVRQLLKDEFMKLVRKEAAARGILDMREVAEARNLKKDLEAVQKKAIEDLKTIMMNDLALLTPFDWPPERIRYEMEQVVQRGRDEVTPKVEDAKRTFEYESRPRTMGGGEAMRQLRKIDREKRWENQ